MSAGDWSGRKVTKARAIVSTWLPAPCGRCKKTVEPDSDWVVGHKIARSVAPELTLRVANWQPEHRACSDQSGQAAVIEKARRDGVQAAIDSGALFSLDYPDGQPPLLPLSLPGPSQTHASHAEPRDGLNWHAETIRTYPWLAEFADVPPEASPPLWMSLPHEDAVGSYGAEAVEWIEQVEKKTLRWWQRLAITRQLEHREDGSLCYRNILESAPRRAGKSVRMRGVALWRMAVGPQIFGEVQTVMHTGSDIPICREIQRGAWRWAEAEWGSKAVTKANGKECVESTTGDRWMVRSQEGVYGYDVTLGLGDECWNVKPDTVSEGLEPATLERISPQVHLTSTAHRRATSLMRGRLSTALSVDDGETLLLVWAAPAGSDPSDAEVWRAASPHWTEDRHRMIAAKYLKAAAGQVDPEADDPDPMAGFIAQYLNGWRLTGRAEPRGTAITTEEQWHALTVLVDDERPDAAAIESWFGDGVTLALAWRTAAGAAVATTDHRDLAAAVTALRATGYRGRTTMGASLTTDPAVRGLAVTPSQTRTTAAVAELSRLVAEGEIQHDGAEHLTAQVLNMRTQPGADGPRVVSKGRADAVKAAFWAASTARSRPTSSGLGIVLPTGVGT